MAFKLSKEDIKAEIIKCGRDPIYFLKNYGKISHPVRGLIPFKTYPFQDDLIKDMKGFRLNVVLKARQMGISTTVAGYIAWFTLFHREKNVLIMATKLQSATNMVNTAKKIIENLPDWLMVADVSINNRTSFELSNGSKCKATATSRDAGRSEALSLMVIDEAAFVDDMEELWTGLSPTISAGGSLIALSSPNGATGWFHRTYVQAETGENNFKPTKLHWSLHPEHDMSWFEKETKGMLPRQIAQEYECLIGNTRVITKEGFKLIQDIVIGDEVLTHKGRFRKVMATRNKEVDRKDIYKLSIPYSRNNPIYITNNHPLLIAEKKCITKERIQNLLKDNDYQSSWMNIEGINEKYSSYTIPQYMNMLFPKLEKSIICEEKEQIDLALYDIVTEKTESSVRYYRQKGDNKRFINIDYSLGKIIGLFLSEGNYVYDRVAQFSFNSEEHELIEYIKDFCKNNYFNYHINERKYSKCTVIYINNKFLVEILKTFIDGNKCFNKTLKEEIYKTNRKFISGIVAGIWLGDGLHEPKNKNILCMANEKLIYQTRLLMFYLGLITRVDVKYNKKYKTQYLLELNNVDSKNIEEILQEGIDINNIVGCRSVYNEEGWWGRITDIIQAPEELEEKEIVYNLEVEEDNSYVCENLVVHNCSFLASGETVIRSEDILEMRGKVIEPIYKTYMDRNYHIWKQYESSGNYLLTADVARGDGADFSVFHVFNVSTMEQVAEYRGKIDLESFANLIASVGKEYGNCMVVVENNNIGYSVCTKLVDMKYPNLYYSTKGSHEYADVNYADPSSLLPGFTTNQKNRPLIIAKLEEFIRNKVIKINSIRTVVEFESFIWHNGRPEARKDYHDDLIMSLAVLCWVRDTALITNDRNKDLSKAILSTITTTSTYVDMSMHGLRKMDIQNNRNTYYNNGPAKDIRDFIWLIKG